MSDWNQLGICKLHTGYEESTLQYVYNKYCGPATPIYTQLDLIRCLKFIHRYPRWRDCEYDLQCSVWSVSNSVLPGLSFLASTLNEIHWEDRLSRFNHTCHFPKYVTGIVDTTALEVNQPKDAFAQRLLYNGKYKACVYKFQIGIDFLGRIILFSGPHLGTTYDAHIWQQTANLHPIEQNECLLGDGHYSVIPDFITPPRQPRHGHMSDDDYVLYALIAHYRARVEHINSSFKRHEAFKVPFRGGPQLLSEMAHISAHISNIEFCKTLRYPPYGPWSHF